MAELSADEWRALDAIAIDRAVANGDLHADEIYAAATEMHRQWHDTINAVVEWYDEPDAPQITDVAEPALRAVPMLRKDYGSAEQGRLVEMGSRLAAGHRAPITAPFIEAFLGAGAHVVGRSAVPEFIQHGTTESTVHGATRNPWSPGSSAGGSSGGAAAAVAAGVVPIAHASDCAGSIRIPASACGLVGLKPSHGRVPWPGHDWNGIATEFVLTRTVRDCQRVLDLLDTSLAGSPFSLPPMTPQSVALSTDHWAGFETDPVVVEAAERVALIFEAEGIQIELVDGLRLVDYQKLMSTWVSSFNRFAMVDAERLAAQFKRPIDATTLEPMTLQAIELARSLGFGALERDANARASIKYQFEGAMRRHEVLLTPTLGRPTIPLSHVDGHTPPLEYEDRNNEIFPYSYLPNIIGWAAVSVPAGQTSDGHPIGIQLSARPGSEAVLLELALMIEQAQPWPLCAPLIS